MGASADWASRGAQRTRGVPPERTRNEAVGGRPDEGPEPLGDVAAIRARLASGALDAIGSQYAATHGLSGERGRRSAWGAEPETDRWSGGGQRWALSGRALLAGVIIVLFVAGAVGWRVLGRAPGQVIPLSSLGVSNGAPGGATDAGAPSTSAEAGVPGDTRVATGAATGADVDPAQGVIVHVTGHVKDPGIVRLGAGARVFDALAQAGGATKKADLSQVNLARPLTDGEQVYIPARGEPGASGGAPPAPGSPAVPGTSGAVGNPLVPASPAVPGSPAGTASGGALIDLNSADAQALQTLPGIGPVLADRIVAHRSDQGPFSSVEQLLEVSGIGPAIMGRIKDLVRT